MHLLSPRLATGIAYNSAERYKGVYDSVEDANFELQEAGIVAPPTILEAGAGGLKLTGIAAEQLKRAGLRRHHTSGL